VVDTISFIELPLLCLESASDNERANNKGDGNDPTRIDNDGDVDDVDNVSDVVPKADGRPGDENAVGNPPDDGNNATILSFNIDNGAIVEENDGENDDVGAYTGENTVDGGDDDNTRTGK
jgi:hypothetical protein